MRQSQRRNRATKPKAPRAKNDKNLPSLEQPSTTQPPAPKNEGAKKSTQEAASSSSTPSKNDVPARGAATARYHRPLLVGICSLLIAFACLYVYHTLQAPTETKVQGHITQFGKLDISFAGEQSNDISPLCGCEKKPETNRWRGITFMARDVALQRTGDLPDTMFFVTAATPNPIQWEPYATLFDALIVRVAIPRSAHFQPKTLIPFSVKLPKDYQLLGLTPLESVEYLQIHTSQRLNVSLNGPIPLGTYVPLKGSKVELATFASETTGGLTSAIKEDYANIFQKPASGEEISDTPQMPLAEFLGPNLVMWSEDPNVAVATPKIYYRTGKLIQSKTRLDATQFKCITAVVIVKGPFSTRVAFVPAPDLNPDPGRYGLGVRWSSGSGTCSLSIENPVLQAADFAKVYSTIRKNEHITISGIEKDPSRVTLRTKDGPMNGWHPTFISPLPETFRYPPIPPNGGFNVFGAFQYLSFSAALGAINLEGDPDTPILTPKSLELTDIRRLDIGAPAIEAPVRVDRGQANLQLNGVAKVKIDGTPLRRRIDNFREFGTTCCTWIGIISAFLSFSPLLVWLKTTGASIKSKNDDVKPIT